MRILAVAGHPGPAEGVGPVVGDLRKKGHEVLLVGVGGDRRRTRASGGSAAVFQSQGLGYTELWDIGYHDDLTRVPESVGQSLVDTYRPERILAGCSADGPEGGLGIEEVLIAAGVRSSIEVVQLVESWGVWYRRLEVPLASRYATLDDMSARIMVARGAPAASINVTGHPGLDAYAGDSAETRSAALRERLGVGTDRVVVFFGQPDNTNSSLPCPEALTWVAESLQPHDRLIFSQHPRDHREYSHVLGRAGDRVVESNLDSHQLLSVADVSITQHSTMGLKSALLDIPTINIVLEGDMMELRQVCGGFPLTVLNANYEVHSKRGLRRVLAGDLEGRGASLREALQVDGNATQRVARLLTGDH